MRRLGMVLLAILFLFMLFAGPAAPKSEAVVVSTVVIGAVIAAMAAAGIGLTVSGMTSAQLQDWVSGKLNEWTTAIGGSLQDHIDNNLITLTANGILSIGTAAASGITNFINWLKIEDSIPDNSITPIVSDLTVLKIDDNLYHSIVDNTATFFSIKRSSNIELYVATVKGTYSWGPLVVSIDQSASYYLSREDYYQDPNSVSYSTQLNTSENRKYYEDGDFTLYYNPGWFSGTGGDLNSATQIYSSSNAALNAIAESIRTNSYGSELSYTTTVVTVPTIQESDKWFLDVGAEPGSTVETATDGVIADTIDGTLTVSGEVAEEEPEFEVNGPIGVSGLTEVFPFCIPFDIYDLLSLMAAEPETPVFTVRFVIPGIINEEFTIDLTPFNAVAQIVRTMELICFAIGLALVTRERFLRS